MRVIRIMAGLQRRDGRLEVQRMKGTSILDDRLYSG